LNNSQLSRSKIKQKLLCTSILKIPCCYFTLD